MQNAAAAAEREVRDAVELFRQGDHAQAERGCRSALELIPRHRDARVLLGMVLLSAARNEEAAALFAELVAAEPQERSFWINLGTARRGAKQFDGALHAYMNAAQLGASGADFFYNVGLTHSDRLDFEAARAVLERAVALAPTDAEIRYRYAQACYDCRRPAESLRALTGWQELAGQTTEVIANIATLLMSLGDSVQADAAFARVSRDPAVEPRVLLVLIEALERTNRLSEARSCLNRLIAHPAANSLGVDLLLIESQLAEREGQYETACRLLRQVLDDINEPHLRHFQLFRLAKNLDALNRTEEAYAALQEAHSSQIAYFSLTVPALSLRGVPTMTITKYGCDAADVASWDHSAAPAMAESPIFIVAFPRSGTTLLELTLDAHPLLRSMDEQPFLQDALQDLQERGLEYPERLGTASNAQLEAVRAAYWERVGRKVTLEQGQRLVDKNPLNILRLPVIRRLFPEAPILFAVRHPCDVLLSCFMQHFRSPDFALLCADLRTAAQGYRRTMDFWYRELRLLQSRVHEIRYENLVDDFEGEIRIVCDFLQLPLDERVLSPNLHAKAKGYISTPSYSQVVQPVNKKAIGKWRRYEHHFARVLPLLEPYFERWGYEA